VILVIPPKLVFGAIRPEAKALYDVLEGRLHWSSATRGPTSLGPGDSANFNRHALSDESARP